MTLPTYATALEVPDLPTVAADLISRIQPSVLAGWPDDAPQRQLANSEANALRFEMLQRALVTRAASPSLLRTLPAWLVSQGYTAATAAELTSAWVDVAIGFYGRGFGRIAATYATWTIPVISTSPQTIDANSVLVFQASDNTLFLAAQVGSAVQMNVGNSYQNTIAIRARLPGTTGNVVAGTILFVIQGPAGLRVNSGTQTPVAVARDAETDGDALDRAQSRWDTLGVGWTTVAWGFLVRQYAPTITGFFIDDANPRGPGTLDVYLRNAAGAATTQEVTDVQAGMTSDAGRPVSSGNLLAKKAVVDSVTYNVTIQGSGSNPNLQANALAAVALLKSVFPVGPAKLVASLLEGILLGSTHPDPIPVVTGSTVTYVNYPGLGFGGAIKITFSDINSHDVPPGNVLALVVNVTVTA